MHDKKYVPINGINVVRLRLCSTGAALLHQASRALSVASPDQQLFCVDPMMHQYAAADVYSVPCYYCFMVLIKGALLAR